MTLRQPIEPPLTAMFRIFRKNKAQTGQLQEEQLRPIEQAGEEALDQRLDLTVDRIDIGADLVEINPLVVTEDRRLIALDAKMSFDDNALFRHQNISELRDKSQEDPREMSALDRGLNYVGLEGNIGCIINGANPAGRLASNEPRKSSGAAPKTEKMRQLIRNARSERQRDKPPASSRKLFQLIRDTAGM